MMKYSGKIPCKTITPDPSIGGQRTDVSAIDDFETAGMEQSEVESGSEEY